MDTIRNIIGTAATLAFLSATGNADAGLITFDIAASHAYPGTGVENLGITTTQISAGGEILDLATGGSPLSSYQIGSTFNPNGIGNLATGSGFDTLFASLSSGNSFEIVDVTGFLTTDNFGGAVALSTNGTTTELFSPNVGDIAALSPTTFGTTNNFAIYGGGDSFAVTSVTLDVRDNNGGGTQIAEPGTLALAGLGMLGIAAAMRRREEDVAAQTAATIEGPTHTL